MVVTYPPQEALGLEELKVVVGEEVVEPVVAKVVEKVTENVVDLDVAQMR